MSGIDDLHWWQKAVFYQIYPRSFADGNGDGIGDFLGMIDRLDYLSDLGVDALWLSPHFASPNADCGYDISDYKDVAPEYGTLEDFWRFLNGAHERGMSVILDLVLNHTSDQHPWFLESKASRDNPKRDWYVWRDGKGSGRPNNWYSGFGGSAWEYDKVTDQYYYHFFLKEQPDLNWHNPEVKQGIWDAVRFWLDMGVDGYRLDAIGTIFEAPGLPDHTATLTQIELYQALVTATTEDARKSLGEQAKAMMAHQMDQPGVHQLMQELRALVNEYPDCVLVGESDEIAYYGDGDNELHLAFNFPLVRTERLTPEWVRKNQQERLAALPPGAWPCNTLGNHDMGRVYSHFGDGENEDELARLSLALMLTLRGTPFLYNGEEIGMTDLLLDDIQQLRDTPMIRNYHMAVKQVGLPPEQALAIVAGMTRDKNRTPMQWANAPNAGFSPAGVATWLPVNPNYAQGVNVADQLDRDDSLLSFYRRLLNVRKSTPALIAGSYAPLLVEGGDCLVFRRDSPADGQSCLVALNFSDREQVLALDLEKRTARALFSSRTREHPTDDVSNLRIAQFEVYIAEI